MLHKCHILYIASSPTSKIILNMTYSIIRSAMEYLMSILHAYSWRLRSISLLALECAEIDLIY